jgi:hypothetical protein
LALGIRFLENQKTHTNLYTSSNITFIHIIPQELVSCFKKFGWLVVTLLSLSLASIVAGVLSMPSAVVTAEPDLENDWHPWFNPFGQTIVVEE